MFTKLLQITSRKYATGGSKLVVNFAAPYKSISANKVWSQVNLSTTDGDVGILAGHVPVVLELLPSVVTLIGDSTEKYFVSGGFAIVNPDSSLNINAVEAHPLSDLDQDAAKRALDAASKLAASSSNPQEQAEAKIQVQVLEAISQAKA